MKKFLTCAVGVLLLQPFLVSVNAQTTPAEGYHDFQALSAALQKTAALNPRITELSSIGKSRGGRDLWLLRISGTKGDPLQKQALLVCANLEGDHLIGSEVALGMAERLVRGYGTDENVTRILDKRTFYFIPRLNPDGAEYFFQTPLMEHPGNLRPRDLDYDWKTDEDGPEDLNGDGFITLMRVKDQDGAWTVDDKDPRLMRKKKPDTPVDSLFELYPEGNDDDGDEAYNEDGPGGFDINRNFPHNFGYMPKGMGVYAASEAESLALLEFMNAYDPKLSSQPHKNICGVLIFSKYDNLAAGSGIESGTPAFPEPPQASAADSGGSSRMFMMFSRRGQEAAPLRPARDPQPKKTETADEALFERMSEKYKTVTGIGSALSEKPVGSLLEYAYFQFGVPAFSANLWSVRTEAARPAGKRPAQAAAGESPAGRPPTGQAPAGDRAAMMRQMAARPGGAARAGGGDSESSAADEKWLSWIDKKNDGQGFIAWTPFRHKQLGEVEIGGFRPYLKLNPPADVAAGLVEKHAAFALDFADEFAEIEMDTPQVAKLSSRAFEVKITVRNRGSMPYATAMGLRSRNIPPIVLQLKFADDKSMTLFGGSKRVDLPTLAAGAEKEYRWIVISPPGKTIDVKLWARHGGGKSSRSITLK